MGYIGKEPAQAGTGTLQQFIEIASTAKTTFTITSGYVPGLILVYLNGILLDSTDYVASNGSTVVLNIACEAGDVFSTIMFGTYTITDAVRRSGDIFNGNVGIGTATVTVPFEVSQSQFTNTVSAVASFYNRTDTKAGGELDIIKAGSTASTYGPYTAGSVGINSTATLLNIGTENSFPLIFYTNNTERSRIDVGGRFLIGSTTGYNSSFSDNLRLQIHGTTDATGGVGIFRWANDTSQPSIRLNKSRGAAIGTQTVVSNNDIIGSVNFEGDDGTAFIPAASIRAEVDGTPGTNDMPGRLLFMTTADGAASTTERLRISNTGLITVGTNGVLAVQAGAVTAPSFSFAGDSNTGIWSPAADTFAISTNGTERIRFSSAGALGLSGATFGTSGQVLTSAGSGGPPTWTTLTVTPSATVAEYRAKTAGRLVEVAVAYQSADLVTLTDAATVAVDFSAGINFTLTATGGVGATRALGNPTNTTVGQSGVIIYIQDGTGSRALTWGANYDFAGGTAPTASTAANAIDVFTYWVRTSTSIVVSTLGKAIA